MKLYGLALVAALGVASAPVEAATIALFNTGVDGAGTVLPDGTIGDPHYSLIAVPGGTTDVRVRTSAGGFPIPPYLGDSTTSAWIGPNNDSQLNSVPGTYIYRTTFNLSGFPSTAVINGGWSSDNDGLGIYLNGVLVSGPTSFSQFSTGYAPFSITTAFVLGLNELDFWVHNGGTGVGNNAPGNNPTALRVELSGTVSEVPLPAALPLFATALVGGGVVAWRKRRKEKTQALAALT